MGERTARGIMDHVQAVQDDVEWEQLSVDYVPGMGLGATKQATRWAYIGYCMEMEQFIKSVLTKKRGRPPKSELASIDARRAFLLWKMVNQTFSDSRLNCTVDTLINMVIAVEEHLKLPMRERAFPPGGSYASSISRGKKILEIDANWNSQVCEKIDAN